ncbi:AVT1 [Symbiodinium natans]|uniref:AVT1 protein n=1 Tax=Symbiodinium natans TaxID=878477 RepID=A0A812TJW6_9DINO|nr:AVT1 [Symbiodinium natans]
MLEKGFGFCQLEDPERTMDVFLHINSFEGQKPDDFSGLPGLPPVGQEVELKLADNTVRPRATWARIVGPALPVDKSKVLFNCLSHVLKSPERFLEGKQQKAGWYKLVDVLATDQTSLCVGPPAASSRDSVFLQRSCGDQQGKYSRAPHELLARPGSLRCGANRRSCR